MDILDKNYRKSRKNRGKIKYIVITSIDIDMNGIKFMERYKHEILDTSYHYIVDSNNVYNMIDDNDTAYHCSCTKMYHDLCRDNNSIGICVIGNIDEYMITKLQTLIGKFNVPRENILRQYDVTHRNMESPLMNDKLWKSILNIESKYGLYRCDEDCVVYGMILDKPMYPLGKLSKDSKVYISSCESNNDDIYASIWTSTSLQGYVNMKHLSKSNMYMLDESNIDIYEDE